MLRTGRVVVRVTTRVSSSPRSIAMVVSETATVTTCPAWIRPRETGCRQTRMTQVAATRRCTVTGSLDGRGGARRHGRRAAGNLLDGQRVGADPQQLPGVGVEEHQQGRFDPCVSMP